MRVVDRKTPVAEREEGSPVAGDSDRAEAGVGRVVLGEYDLARRNIPYDKAPGATATRGCERVDRFAVDQPQTGHGGQRRDSVALVEDT